MRERERESHFGSRRRPTLWLEFPLTFTPSRSAFVEAKSSCVVSWYLVPTMFRKMLGLAFLTAGFAATVASSVFGSRASVAVDTGLRSPMAFQALLRQRPRSQGGTESEGHVQCQSCPLDQVANLGKLLVWLKDSELFQGIGGVGSHASQGGAGLGS